MTIGSHSFWSEVELEVVNKESSFVRFRAFRGTNPSTGTSLITG